MSETADKRDGRTWVVIELTRAGDLKKEDGTLAATLIQALGAPKDFPIFIPAVVYSRGGRRVAIHLMEGYVFVATGLPEIAYFALERDKQYVRRVLSVVGPAGIRVMSVVHNDKIEEMRRKLKDQVASDIMEGMRVRITEGVYSALEGEVLDVEDEEAHVRILLRSIDLIVRVPKMFLDPSDSTDEFDVDQIEMTDFDDDGIE